MIHLHKAGNGGLRTGVEKHGVRLGLNIQQRT